MQAQTPHTAYVGLWTRLEGFRGDDLSTLLLDRSVVRMALMRGTIHLVTAADAWGLRPLVQPVMDRVQKSQFGKRLAGVDLDEVVAMGRAFVDEQPRTFKALGDHLLTRWPDRDRFGLEQAVRTGVPLVQVPPRGLWGRSGPIAHTSIEAWLGEPPADLPTIDAVLMRYVAAFGPVSVMDAQAWCGLTKLGEVFERLRPSLITFRDEGGRELFDLPDAPRPDPETPAPPRFLYDFENMLLSYADRSRRDRARDGPRAGAHPGIAEHLHARRVRGGDLGRRARTRASHAHDHAPGSPFEGRCDRPLRRRRRPLGIPRRRCHGPRHPLRRSPNVTERDRAGPDGTEPKPERSGPRSCTVAYVDVTIRER